MRKKLIIAATAVALTLTGVAVAVPALAERGGHHGGGRHGGGQGLSEAAAALDMTRNELRTALEPDGTTLADVAEEQGVAAGTLVEALVRAAQEHIARAVQAGRITREQADERLADLEERVTERVNSARPGDGPGLRGHGHRDDAPADED